MIDLRRLVINIIRNFTISPLIMAVAAMATGVDPAASFGTAFALFWPALLANAGLQSEIAKSEWREKTRKFAIHLLFAEILFLPMLVILVFWLNPSVSLLLQNVKGWVIGAAVAGGANPTIGALRVLRNSLFNTDRIRSESEVGVGAGI